jgi:uncharacterized membrane protein
VATRWPAPMPIVLGFAIGIFAGLRALTLLAAVAWAAQSHQLALRQSTLAFMAASITAYIFTASACVELFVDKLPGLPSRLTLGPLALRILSGGLCGAVLCTVSGYSPVAGAIAGVVGAIAGALAGYHARRALTIKLGTRDLVVAVIEDVVAIGGALLIVSQV